MSRDRRLQRADDRRGLRVEWERVRRERFRVLRLRRFWRRRWRLLRLRREDAAARKRCEYGDERHAARRPDAWNIHAIRSHSTSRQRRTARGRSEHGGAVRQFVFVAPTGQRRVVTGQQPASLVHSFHRAALILPGAEHLFHRVADRSPLRGADTTVEAPVRHDLHVAIRQQHVDQDAVVRCRIPDPQRSKDLAVPGPAASCLPRSRWARAPLRSRSGFRRCAASSDSVTARSIASRASTGKARASLPRVEDR